MQNINTLINCIKQNIEILDSALTQEEYKNDVSKLLSTAEFLINESVELKNLLEEYHNANS